MPTERVQRRINALLDEAEAALAHNEWQVAAERARAVLAIDPENADVVIYLRAAERGSGASPAAAREAVQGRAALQKRHRAPVAIPLKSLNKPEVLESDTDVVELLLEEPGERL